MGITNVPEGDGYTVLSIRISIITCIAKIVLRGTINRRAVRRQY